MKRSEMTAWIESRRDLWLDLLRIYLGVGLFIRGLIFFSHGSEVMLRQLVGTNASDWFWSAAIAHYVAAAHLAGGVFLAFGLLTRIAAAVQIPVLVGAVIAHAPDGLFALGQSLEFAAYVLVTLIIITIAGAGRLSVDYYTFGKGRHIPLELDEAEHPSHEAHMH